MNIDPNQPYATYIQAWQQQSPNLIPEVKGEQQLFTYWLYYQLHLMVANLPDNTSICPILPFKRQLQALMTLLYNRLPT
jgi:hypothetical protein